MKRFVWMVLCLVMALVYARSNVFSNETLKKFDSDKGSFNYSFGKTVDYNDVLVNRVVDGDTLRLETGERVRLIGIDTPELHESSKLNRDSARTGQSKSAIQKLGKQSYEFTRQLVEGKRVSLEFDVEKRVVKSLSTGRESLNFRDHVDYPSR